MKFRTLKLRWAKKLLKAKFFVVMTDTESAIAFEGANPDNFEDVVALAAQTAELENFYQQLGGLVKDHKAAVANLMGGSIEEEKSVSETKPVTKSKAKSTKPSKSGKKIEVKQK
jgi:hypothetical protein